MPNTQQNGLTARILEYVQQREAEELKNVKDDAKRLKIAAKYEPQTWLSEKARTAKSVAASSWQSFSDVTHVAKFVHGGAEASSVSTTGAKETDGYISTPSVAMLTYDTACNAAALPIKPFLLLEHDGRTLIDALRQGDVSPLLEIAPDETTAQEWASAFISAFEAKEPDAHMIKQCYWPVPSDGYHLQIPLYPTSFAQAIYASIQRAKFSGEAKATRKARSDEQESDREDVRYPNLAIQSFGGSNKQNISQLNSPRGGKAYLFSCAPPTWKRRNAPPLHISSVFPSCFERQVRSRHIKPLQEFLYSVRDKDTNARIRKHREGRVDALIDVILSQAADIQQMQPGWSADPDCRLPLAEQYWLDPERAETDEGFRSERDAADWQTEVANTFAIWLSRKLERNGLAFGADEQHALRSDWRNRMREGIV